MKIIKEPTLKTYKHICKRCGCEFEFDVRDVETRFDYDCCRAREQREFVIKCPFCKLNNVVGEEERRDCIKFYF